MEVSSVCSVSIVCDAFLSTYLNIFDSWNFKHSQKELRWAVLSFGSSTFCSELCMLCCLRNGRMTSSNKMV